jgi:predicted small metal-binding protein
VARAETDEQIMELVAEHARERHKMAITPDLANRIRGLIQDVRRDEQGAA